MMATRRYTVEQLLHLRGSPLVKKPESLPAIEQWLEYVYLDVDGSREKLRIPHSEVQQQPRQSASGRQQRPVVDASPMGNFSTGQRPGLMQARSLAAKSGGEDDIYIYRRTRFKLTRDDRRYYARTAKDHVCLQSNHLTVSRLCRQAGLTFARSCIERRASDTARWTKFWRQAVQQQEHEFGRYRRQAQQG